MNKIGTLFLDAEHYASQANKTVGQPIIGTNMEQLIENRRGANSELTPAGEAILSKVRSYFKANLHVKVYIRWSRYAGCSSCPCSPGFNIMVSNEDFFLERWNRKGNNRDACSWAIWTKRDGTLDIRDPKSDWPVKKPTTLVGLA